MNSADKAIEWDPCKIYHAGNGKRLYFPTARRAAKYLAAEYGKPEKSFNDRFYMRRSHIFDYDVIYGMQRLDAATA